MKKKLKIAGYTALYGMMALGMIAKVINDRTTHGMHSDHNPCDCHEQCLSCAFLP